MNKLFVFLKSLSSPLMSDQGSSMNCDIQPKGSFLSHFALYFSKNYQSLESVKDERLLYQYVLFFFVFFTTIIIDNNNSPIIFHLTIHELYPCKCC